MPEMSELLYKASGDQFLLRTYPQHDAFEHTIFCRALKDVLSEFRLQSVSPIVYHSNDVRKCYAN